MNSIYNSTSEEMSAPSVEIRIPISANEKFLRMLRYFLESLQTFGGVLGRNAKVAVSVSRDEPFRNLAKEHPWISHYDVEFNWVNKEIFNDYGYQGTSFNRLKADSDADIVILADSDIFVANNFDSIIRKVYSTQKVHGFIAHLSPFGRKDLRDTSSWKWWERIFKEADLPLNHFKHIYTGWGFMSRDRRHRHCPYYYNNGFVISPRKYIDKMASTFRKDLQTVEKVINNRFKSQIANTLSFERHQIPCEVMSVNYNFPLHVEDEKMRNFNPDPNGENSPEDIKIFHYLGRGEFNREDFSTEQKLESALARKNVSESGRVFQQKLKIVHNKLRSYDLKYNAIDNPVVLKHAD